MKRVWKYNKIKDLNYAKFPYERFIYEMSKNIKLTLIFFCPLFDIAYVMSVHDFLK